MSSLTTSGSPINGGGGGAAGTVAIGGTVTSGTAGSVLFLTTGGALSQDNANFFYDDTDHQLVMGAGTVGKPSIIFGDDTTGLFRAGANQIGIALSGVLAMGVGVAAGAADQTFGAGRFLADSRNAGDMHISHLAQTGSTAYALRVTSAGVTRLNSASGQNVLLTVAGTSRWILNGTNFDLSPAADNTTDLGLTATRVRRLYMAEYWEGSEQTAPAAPGADKGRVFFQDNGAGKTQMMVIFSSGAAQQLAIQP